MRREFLEAISEKVAEAGLEPARPNGHRILNPERLPIPPLGQGVTFVVLPFSGSDLDYWFQSVSPSLDLFLGRSTDQTAA